MRSLLRLTKQPGPIPPTCAAAAGGERPSQKLSLPVRASRVRGVRTGSFFPALLSAAASASLPRRPSPCLQSGGAARILASMSEVTRILSAIEQGDPHAAAQLLPLVYAELRRLAAQKLAQETPGQT